MRRASRYHLNSEVTDRRPGWRTGGRVLPRRLTIRVQKLARFYESGGEPVELTAVEERALADGAPTVGDDWAIGAVNWIELEVESGPDQPPRCVALRAPRGISTPEQRFPLAGVVTEVTAGWASKDGTFLDWPQDIDYEDVVFEIGRTRGRERARQPVTDERLEEVARISRENPRKPTAAVQHRLGISRGYAIRLKRLAESAGYEVR